VLAALTGWSSFAYSAWSSRGLAGQVSTLSAERDDAIAKFQKLERSAGELSKVEAKLGSVRAEFNKAIQMGAAAQHELAGLMKRSVSQTGSIRPPNRPSDQLASRRGCLPLGC
jgi:hypothetical protein